MVLLANTSIVLLIQPYGVVNKTFIRMMEALGYDIELTYAIIIPV
ncbi:hypothetical protein SMUE_10060 [Enterococcus cecorum]